MADMRIQTSFDLAPPIGYAGQIAGGDEPTVISMKNVEASASMLFGRGVCFKTSASGYEALLPAANTDKVAGIVIRSNAYEYLHGLDDNGVMTGYFVNVLRKGRVLVVTEDGCSPGDPLYIRCTAAGDPEFLGGLVNAADGTKTIDCSRKGTWMTKAAAGELAWLEVDFTGSAA